MARRTFNEETAEWSGDDDAVTTYTRWGWDDDADAPTDYIGGLWGDWRKGTTDRAMVAAHRTVQSFVDTFATPGHKYNVVFDPSVGVAGTNPDTRTVAISPAPALDRTLTGREAGQIMTGIAVHEAAHDRYGASNFNAVDATYGKRADNDLSKTAWSLSNTLNDIHDERSLVADYPGYADVFSPVIKYVAEGAIKNGVSPHLDPADDPVNFAIGATRYADYLDWNGNESERDWWMDWADRNWNAATPADHVAAVAEGIAHINATATNPPTNPNTNSGDGDGNGDLPVCIARGVDDAAKANGVSGKALAAARQSGQSAVDTDATLVESEPNIKGFVADAPPVPEYAIAPVATSPAATAAIRNAFIRSRTGITNVDRAQKRGSLDSTALHRIAMNDYRLFERRRAPSPGRYLFYLLVDRSASMAGSPTRQTISTVKPFVAASRSMPSIRVKVFGWTSPDHYTGGGLANYAALKVWETGNDPNRLDALGHMHEGGTPDARVMAWAGKAIADDAAMRNEIPVIVMLSDGDGEGDLKVQIENARKRGVIVISVAIGNDMEEISQKRNYGENNYVPWAGSIEATAGPLARMIGRIVATNR